jgi:hypothetical protein
LLAKKKKALVIYEVGHFGINPSRPTLRMLIDSKSPDALFLVTPVLGYAQEDCVARFSPHMAGWAVPSLITPVRGSTLEGDLWRPGCNPQTRPPDMPEEMFDASGRNYLGLNSDALLYLGPRRSLVFGPRSLDIILDSDYRAEMDRRMTIMTGKPLGPPNTANNVPQSYFPD